MTLYTECKWYLRWGAWPRYLSRWRVCIRWQRRRRWVWTRWCRKWIICQVWKLRTKCRKCCCKKATSSRIWTAFLIRFYEKRVGLIKSKLLLACLLASSSLNLSLFTRRQIVFNWWFNMGSNFLNEWKWKFRRRDNSVARSPKKLFLITRTDLLIF